MYFTFDFLKYNTSKKYSISHENDENDENGNNQREQKLLLVSNLFDKIFKQTSNEIDNKVKILTQRKNSKRKKLRIKIGLCCIILIIGIVALIVCLGM